MTQTGTYVNPSRNQLGPDTAPKAPLVHRVRQVDAVGTKSVATCVCGWRSAKRRTPSIAREALQPHIDEKNAAQAS